MDLIFLDANVPFCAAYRFDAGLRKLWRLPGVWMVTSAYAVEEARRNLSNVGQRRELDKLLRSVEVVPTAAPTDHPLFSSVELPDKDRPHTARGDRCRSDAPTDRRLLALRPSLRGEYRRGSYPPAGGLPLFKDRTACPYKRDVAPLCASFRLQTPSLRNEPILREVFTGDLRRGPRRRLRLWPRVAGRCPHCGGRPGGAAAHDRPCRISPLSRSR